MTRSVFFSFHYGRDIWRVNQIRNSGVTKPYSNRGFRDASLWEESWTQDEDAVKQKIDEALIGTSVTVVLIGRETADRPWVHYEIEQSFKKEKRNGFLGIHLCNLEDKNGKTDQQGKNPFNEYLVSDSGRLVTPCTTTEHFLGTFLRDGQQDGRFSRLKDQIKVYDWKNDDGYNNFGDWVEEAAQNAGRRPSF
jgi:hypothetical protein